MQAVSTRQVVVAIIFAMIEDRETNELQIQLHTKKLNERSCSILLGFALGLDQDLASHAWDSNIHQSRYPACLAS